MTRRYPVVIEGDESGYSAWVPDLPAILITGRTLEELTTRASEAIQLYLSVQPAPTVPSFLREVEVEIPA